MKDLRGLAFSTATSFPSELSQGHTWDTATDRRDWTDYSEEARALGYTTSTRPRLTVRAINAGAESKIPTAKILISCHDSAWPWRRPAKELSGRFNREALRDL
jgi:hypothetical protein